MINRIRNIFKNKRSYLNAYAHPSCCHRNYLSEAHTQLPGKRAYRRARNTDPEGRDGS